MNSSNKLRQLSLLTLFFLFSLLAHYQAQIPFELFADRFGIGTLYLLIGVGMAALGVILIYQLINGPRKTTSIADLRYSWIFILLLAIVCYFTIMPYKTEAMHYIQYGIMGALCLRVLDNPFAAVNLSFFLGIIDELAQFLFGSGVYFDFNDVVLNFTGSFGGVLFYISFFTYQYRLRYLWMYWVNAAFGGMLCIGLLTGLVCFFNEGQCPLYLCIWESDRLQTIDIWEYAWETPWHRIRPLVGSLLIILLPLTALRLNPKS